MTHTSPDLIAIDHDDYHATHVGRIPDGWQFFVTTPFVPRIDNDPGREFVAVFLFDPDGAVVEARIDDLGSREALNEAYAQQVFDKRVRELGQSTTGVSWCGHFRSSVLASRLA